MSNFATTVFESAAAELYAESVISDDSSIFDASDSVGSGLTEFSSEQIHIAGALLHPIYVLNRVHGALSSLLSVVQNTYHAYLFPTESSIEERPTIPDVLNRAADVGAALTEFHTQLAENPHVLAEFTELSEQSLQECREEIGGALETLTLKIALGEFKYSTYAYDREEDYDYIYGMLCDIDDAVLDRIAAITARLNPPQHQRQSGPRTIRGIGCGIREWVPERPKLEHVPSWKREKTLRQQALKEKLSRVMRVKKVREETARKNRMAVKARRLSN
ncbi:hypothetical protein SAICODRAFT_8725 [Saitoella complicata NRRL Y-17804]|uniref:Uncharacterized protein n=1 Tax=Saitoella complicata (strain BCRC 22490 / CBS 7301 / JCM 7358 / NBRC 10748 / NRRL Y-17804) TaxID=698492 RepID=A0A0E9NNM6_SAICN|nr:uncharacterized protein SAICODRAFT_8725 [Saitoella complicata NRRL Y-17804]ODQ51797.1 hypothetical protein SAICODRAFT_8725 [Saitoella complicata NRRL Y-17804]GAO51398.1 hypothetical protein G7K_5500-t1 [Saitoella complicata NRRL Y-17804]